MAIDYGNAKEKNFITNEGAVYVGDFGTIQATKEYVETLKDKVLGYFEDKLTISAKPKIEPIKNAAGKTMGWQKITEWNVKVGGSLLEFNSSLLELSLFDKAEEGHYIAKYGMLDKTKYKDILVVGENEKAEPIIILIRNVFNKEGLSFDMKGKENAAFKIDLENTFDGQEIPLEIFSNFTQMAKSQGK